MEYGDAQPMQLVRIDVVWEGAQHFSADAQKADDVEHTENTVYTLCYCMQSGMNMQLNKYPSFIYKCGGCCVRCVIDVGGGDWVGGGW